MLKKIMFFIKVNPQYLIYTYWLLIVGFIAFAIDYAIVPDEAVHFTAVEYYSRHTPNPFLSEQSDSFNAGQLTRLGSYIYYYLMGFVYNFGIFINKNPLILVRLLSALFSLGTLIYLNKIADLLRVEKKIKLAALFLIANLPMFLIISAGVNYDSLSIFVSTLIAYHFIQLSKKFTVYRSLILFNLIILAPLVKFSLAPISLVAVASYAILFFTRAKSKKKNKNIKTKEKIIISSLLIALVIISGILIERYVINYIDYGVFNPVCDQVLTKEQCASNFVYQRDQQYIDAQLQQPTINYIHYTAQWLQIMNARTYGVLAHNNFIDNYTVIYTGLLISIVLVLMFIRRFMLTRKNMYIAVVAVFYTAVLIYVNAGGYERSQQIGLAVQGRYLFPVAFIFTLLTLSLYTKEFNKIRASFAYKLLIILLITFALLAGPFNLYYGTNSTWWFR